MSGTEIAYGALYWSTRTEPAARTSSQSPYATRARYAITLCDVRYWDRACGTTDTLPAVCSQYLSAVLPTSCGYGCLCSAHTVLSVVPPSVC
eukprot:1056188-Rhodomonas_salina.1